jgi:hypothetical protein
MEAVVFKLVDGTIFGLELERIDGLDHTPVTRVSLLDDGEVVFFEQFSGNRVEVPAGLIVSKAVAVCVCPPR